MFSRLIKPSTRRFWAAGKEQGLTLSERVHAYAYARWPYHYIGMVHGKYKLLAVLLGPVVWLLNRRHPFRPGPEAATGDPNQRKASFADTYHGKAMPVAEAAKLVRVNRAVRVEMPEQVVPYTRARDIVLQADTKIILLDCPCRAGRPNPCTPTDVCIIVGDELGDFLLEHQPGRCRIIDADQAVAVIEAENKRGHVAHAFFKDVMLGRFYAICNCCSCCCGAMKAHRHGVAMLCSSGYLAEADPEACIACGLCVKRCQFQAVTMTDAGPRIDESKCMGCGVCVTGCPEQAMTLRLAPEKGAPLEVDLL